MITEEQVDLLIESALEDIRAGHFARADEKLLEAYDAALDHSYDHLLAKACGGRANVLIEQAHYNEAVVWLNRAYAASKDVGNIIHQATIAANLGRVHHVLGDLETALDWYELSLDELESASDTRPETLGAVQLNVAMIHGARGNLPVALEWYYRALDNFSESNGWYGRAKCSGAIGDLYYDTADYDQAIQWYSKALDLYELNNAEAGIALKLCQIGQALMKQEQLDDAISTLRRGVAVAEASGLQRDLVVAHRILSQALVLIGRDVEAEIHVQQALPLAEKLQIQSEVVECLQATADIHSTRGETELALADLNRGLDLAIGLGQDQQVRRMHERLYTVKRDSDPKAALEHLERVMEMKEYMLGEQKQRRLALLEMEHKLSEERREIQQQIDADRQLREQQRDLLTNVMPEAIADRLMSGETMIADAYPDVAIMFLDLVNFTGLASSVPATYVVHILNEIFHSCDIVMKNYGITKIKTIGDAYLAVAGAPESLPDCAGLMARAALDVRDRLDQLQITIPDDIREEVRMDQLSEIDVRIGLHVGSLTAGVIGDERKVYDVWGDAVNVAARMEQTGEQGRIHVSPFFAKRCSGQQGLRFVSRGMSEIKGKGLMETFWLEREV